MQSKLNTHTVTHSLSAGCILALASLSQFCESKKSSDTHAHVSETHCESVAVADALDVQTVNQVPMCTGGKVFCLERQLKEELFRFSLQLKFKSDQVKCRHSCVCVTGKSIYVLQLHNRTHCKVCVCVSCCDLERRQCKTGHERSKRKRRDGRGSRSCAGCG